MEYFLRKFQSFHRPVRQRNTQGGFTMNPDPENGIIIEGFLHKRAGNILKTWQRRWFQVQNHELLYLKRSKTKPRVVIEDLRLCTVQNFSTNRRHFGFKVVSPTMSYILAADSEWTRLAWTSAIEKIALLSQPRPDDSQQWSHQEEPPAPGASDDLRESGYGIEPPCNDLESKRKGSPLVQKSSSPSNDCFWTKYTLGNELGKGCFGLVCTGICKADGRQVAIKYICKQPTMKYITTPGEAEPLPSEVALTLVVSRSPRCHNILELLEWYDHPKYLMLILEKPSPWMDLANYIKDGPLSEHVAQIIMAQVVVAVRHCSARGVHHGDITMRNILVNPDDLNIKLINFGCGDLLQIKPYRAFSGTWYNVPPEMIAFRRYHGCQATVWSLGVLLYRILCGELPFKTKMQTLYKDLRFTRNLSADCCHLISGCLEKEHNDRLCLGEILDHKWLRFHQ